MAATGLALSARKNIRLQKGKGARLGTARSEESGHEAAALALKPNAGLCCPLLISADITNICLHLSVHPLIRPFCQPVFVYVCLRAWVNSEPWMLGLTNKYRTSLQQWDICVNRAFPQEKSTKSQVHHKKAEKNIMMNYIPQLQLFTHTDCMHSSGLHSCPNRRRGGFGCSVRRIGVASLRFGGRMGTMLLLWCWSDGRL